MKHLIYDGGVPLVDRYYYDWERREYVIWRTTGEVATITPPQVHYALINWPLGPYVNPVLIDQ